MNVKLQNLRNIKNNKLVNPGKTLIPGFYLIQRNLKKFKELIKVV